MPQTPEFVAATVADVRLAKPVARPRPADLTHLRVEDKVLIDVATGDVVAFFGLHADGEKPTESHDLGCRLDEKQRAEVLAILLAASKNAPPTEK